MLRVEFDVQDEDIDVAAELVAIHHLVFKRQVFDRIPNTGKPFIFKVSRGAVRKLALGKSDKSFARRYAKFLTGTNPLSDTEILVEEPEEFDPATVSDIETIRVEHEAYHTKDEIETPAFGRLVITSHAVLRFAERSADQGIKRPRASLARRLVNPNLKRFELNAAVKRHKDSKYGSGREAEIWGHESEALKFVIVKDQATGQSVLTTVFSRTEEYWNE